MGWSRNIRSHIPALPPISFVSLLTLLILSHLLVLYSYLEIVIAVISSITRTTVPCGPHELTCEAVLWAAC